MRSRALRMMYGSKVFRVVLTVIDPSTKSSVAFRPCAGVVVSSRSPVIGPSQQLRTISSLPKDQEAHLLLECRDDVPPDLAKVDFAVLWEQGRETALLEERRVALRVRGLLERQDRPVVNVVRVPGCRAMVLSVSVARVRGLGAKRKADARLSFLCCCFFDFFAGGSWSSPSSPAAPSGRAASSAALAAASFAFSAAFLRATVQASDLGQHSPRGFLRSTRTRCPRDVLWCC